jgi:hypothetical protein
MFNDLLEPTRGGFARELDHPRTASSKKRERRDVAEGNRDH